MKHVPLMAVVCLSIVGAIFHFWQTNRGNGAPPYAVEDLEPPAQVDPYDWIRNWKRPDGPPRVGIQVGHWKNEALPSELTRLIGSTGSRGRGMSESEVMLIIAEKTKALLEPHGIMVDILPATVPPRYVADLFIALHADGNEDSQVNGYKAASPRRDFTGKAARFVSILEASYETHTGLDKDPNISRNMTGYYAFAWWRYEHAVHPMTPSVILETGFLTNAYDQKILIDTPERSARGTAEAVIQYLHEEGLLSTQASASDS